MIALMNSKRQADEKAIKSLLTREPGDEYRRDIDGVRAIAVTAVVLFHAGVARLAGGFAGVDVFFVISGYLIGAHIYRDLTSGRFTLARFYQRRAKRILPALLVLLLVCSAICSSIFTPAELVRFGKFYISSLFSFSNIWAWLQANHYFGPEVSQNPLIMTWTLAVEEHFYIFLPLLFLLLDRVGKVRAYTREVSDRVFFGVVSILTLLSFVSCVYFTGHVATFYLIPFRAWELAAGVLMALYENGSARESGVENIYGGKRFANLRSSIGLSLILYTFCSFNSLTPFPGPGALVPVLGAALLLSAPTAWLNRIILSSPPFRWIGLVSYSWYLWHWPMLSFTNIIAMEHVSITTQLAVVLFALVLAWLSYHFVEQPFRHSRMAPGPLLWRYGIVCLLVAVPAILMVTFKGFPQHYPQTTEVERMQEIEPSNPCFANVAPVNTPLCLPKPDGRSAVALWGDSHAAALSPSLGKLVNASDQRFLALLHVSCPPLQGVAHASSTAAFDKTCIDFNAASLKLLLEDRTVRTVVLAGFWSGQMYELPGYIRADQHYPYRPDERAQNLERGLDATVRALRAGGKRVVILEDVPWLQFSPTRRRLADLIPARGWAAHYLLGEQANSSTVGEDEIYIERNRVGAAILSKVASRRGAEIYDLSKQMCRNGRCEFFANCKLLYRDDQHVSNEGAMIALDGIPLP